MIGRVPDRTVKPASWLCGSHGASGGRVEQQPETAV